MDNSTRRGLGARVADFLPDLAALGGAALITYGADLVYRPASFIVAGVFLLCGAWQYAKKAA
jgi:hypothetical protein